MPLDVISLPKNVIPALLFADFETFLECANTAPVDPFPDLHRKNFLFDEKVQKQKELADLLNQLTARGRVEVIAHIIRAAVAGGMETSLIDFKAKRTMQMFVNIWHREGFLDSDRRILRYFGNCILFFKDDFPQIPEQKYNAQEPTMHKSFVEYFTNTK